MRNGCQWWAAALLIAVPACVPGGPSGHSAASDSGAVGSALPEAGSRATSADAAGGDSGAAGPSMPEPRVGAMSADAARSYLADHPEALLLDVRNPDEWNDPLGHIEGARQIPLPELSVRAGEIEAWKDRPVVIVCRSGRRSRLAAEELSGLGFRQLFNLEGGMIAWRESEKRSP